MALHSPCPGAELYQDVRLYPGSPNSQAVLDTHGHTSPKELAPFYEDMQSIERRLMKRNSDGNTTVWTRRSFKRSATAPGPSLSQQQPPPQQQPSSFPLPLDNHPLTNTTRDAQGTEMEKLAEQKEKLGGISIIPDSNLPAWYNKDIWASVLPPMYKAAYRIHNPVGPRWYKNYHLIPPSRLRPAARPPSFFSPSFPHIHTISMPEHSLDSSRLAVPSRTPSGTPLPTPSSSQTRVGDAAHKPRSRKPSLTTPDGLEMDITDPWGATWHHSSPYDFGITSTTGHGGTGNDTHVSRSSVNRIVWFTLNDRHLIGRGAPV